MYARPTLRASRSEVREDASERESADSWVVPSGAGKISSEARRATHLLRRWPLRLSRAATCARAVSDWPRARRRARLVAIFQRFELEGELRLIFFERANSRRHPQSWLSARRDSCLFGEFLSLRRLRLSFAPSVKEPGAMASTENMPPLPEAIAALKDEGNGFFRAGDFLKAAGAYTKALKVRPVARPVSRFRITRLANRRSADARGASL